MNEVDVFFVFLYFGLYEFFLSFCFVGNVHLSALNLRLNLIGGLADALLEVKSHIALSLYELIKVRFFGG